MINAQVAILCTEYLTIIDGWYTPSLRAVGPVDFLQKPWRKSYPGSKITAHGLEVVREPLEGFTG